MNTQQVVRLIEVHGLDESVPRALTRERHVGERSGDSLTPVREPRALRPLRPHLLLTSIDTTRGKTNQASTAEVDDPNCA
jgi:hypothetical protein